MKPLYMGIGINNRNILILGFHPDRANSMKLSAERARKNKMDKFQVFNISVDAQALGKELSTFLVSCGATQDDADAGVRQIARSLSEEIFNK